MSVGHLDSRVVSVSLTFADFCTERILYFIGDYSLVCSAASRNQQVTAPNEGRQDVEGGPRLLRQSVEPGLGPSADPTAQPDLEIHTDTEEGRGKQSVS
jgi:hypothetical protein